MSSYIVSESDIIHSFNMAVVSPENIRPDGSIDWGFVDADIHMDASQANMVLPVEYPSIFDSLVNKFLGA